MRRSIFFDLNRSILIDMLCDSSMGSNATMKERCCGCGCGRCGGEEKNRNDVR